MDKDVLGTMHVPVKPQQNFMKMSLDSSIRNGDLDDMNRLSGTPNSSISSSPHWKQTGSPSVSGQSSRGSQKILQIDLVFELQNVAERLMSRLYMLRQILDYPDIGLHQYSDSYWKAGILPDLPKLCLHIAKKFPEHPAKMQLEKVDKGGLDHLHDNAETQFTAMEPWFTVLLDLMRFREQALRTILDLSSTVITLLPHHNPLVLHAFMNLFCAFVRVHILSDKIPRKMLLQVCNLTHIMLRSGQDHDSYHRLVQFVDSYDPPMKGLHDDLNLVGPRIGEVLEAIGPTIFLGADYRKLRSEGFLSPFHPRYPEKLTNSAHPARAQELVNVECYRDWVILGYLVCPAELLRSNGMDIAMAVLKDTLVLPLFRDEYILVHEEYQLYVLPKIAESKKVAKAGRTKQRDADQEYSLAKQVERRICDVHDLATARAESVHRERRTILKQELSQMVLFFMDQPSLLAPNIQMVFSAIALARFEVVWYFVHVGVLSGKSRGARAVPVDIDVSDPTIGFLLDGIEKICGLIWKYTSAIRGYALGYLVGAAERIRSLLGSPDMVALDIDVELEKLFASVSGCLDNLPKFQNEKVATATISLSEFRKDWLSILTLVSSCRYSINIKHLEKATISTGKESIISEGNMAYLWSRSVDDIENQLSQHSSFKVLYFYRQHLTTVFRHTMFGPEGRPQHCCAWLGLATDFSANATESMLEEREKLAGDIISYAESILESIMGGFEGLINILDSEGGFGSLEYKLLPDQAANRMNHAVKYGNPLSKSMRHNSDLPLPGSESEPSNRDSVKMLEAAVQRLTSLCTMLNEMEPYLREHVARNFQRRIFSIITVDGDLQRPSVFEALLHRHMHTVHLIEQHISMDLTNCLREILLTESFTGPMHYLKGPKTNENADGASVSTVCDWYIENIVKDVTGAGVLFSPLEKCFKSSKVVGNFYAEAVADISELKAFIRIFGHYGVDRFDTVLQNYLSNLLNCIAIILRSNKDSLEALATSMHDRLKRESILKHMCELEALMAFSLQLGHTLSFRSLLAEAAAEVIENNVPLLFSLLSDVAKYSPTFIPQREEIHKVNMLASQVGAISELDTAIVHSVFSRMEGSDDLTWYLLPYLYMGCMACRAWSSSTFSIHTGGFNNNMHCLARCINALMVASELARSEHKEFKRQVSQQQSDNTTFGPGKLHAEVLSSEGTALAEANIKLMMKTFVQCSATIVLSGWNENNRSPLVAKLIFLDQFCVISKYLPRSTFEDHVPYTILRSIYQLYYENAVPALVLISPSRRHSANAAPIPARSNHIDSGGDSNGGFPNFRGSAFSGLNKVSAQLRKPVLDMEASSEAQTAVKAADSSGVQLSGPLDYGSLKKVSFANKGASNGAPTMSPLQRFTMSRSGPVTYK
eukprot:c25499_g1_i2 orf=223-4398(+)